MSILTDEQNAELVQWFIDRPSDAYHPGRRLSIDGNPIDLIDNGQFQFHNAPHAIRQLAPGNGWGKTATVAVEVDWWGHRDHPYLKDIPARPRLMVWIAQKHQQWDLMRKKVEAWWPAGVVKSWVGSPRFAYTWPDGSTLSIITAETDWTTVQGIEPDLVIIDESIPVALWREMLKRRRGSTRTKFCISATATQGLDWMYYDVHLPWRKYHEANGITDEREMMRRQLHRWDDPALCDLPGIWCWPQGSHRDNPTATAETWAFYLKTTTGSPAERMVRLYGGFQSFSASPVFDPESVEKMKKFVDQGRKGVIKRKQEA